VALAGYAVVIVGTHLTGLMDEIMTRPWAGQLEHLAYLLVGCQFFVLVVGDEPLRWRLSMPAKQLLLAVAMAIDTFTGVVLLQSTRAISMTGLSPAHLDPLAQTRLGGAIMWVGGDGVMAVLMMGVTLAWLRLPEARKRASRSWLEQARRATFEDRISATGRSIDADLAPRTTHTTGGSGRARAGIDDDEAARIAYNAWLTRIAHNPAAG
jgi:putative copper resistance protein D